jgi:hypothetical protein
LHFAFCFVYRFFLLSTKYATASNPAIANTASKPGIHGFFAVGLGVGVADAVAVGVNEGAAVVGAAVAVTVGASVGVTPFPPSGTIQLFF